MNEIEILRIAAIAARTRSGDPRTQNGAVLCRPDNFIVSAANSFPAGVRPRPEPPEKYTYIEHAERNAIYKAASMGWPTGGATMYCLWFACPDCARAIVQAGIYEVVGLAKTRNSTPDRWLDAVQDGEDILREAGVGMRWLGERIDATIMFDGREMHL
jgi:dCMP deaminase